MYFEEWITAYPPCRMADSTNNVHGALINAWKHEVQPALGFFHVEGPDPKIHDTNLSHAKPIVLGLSDNRIMPEREAG
jgi:hypothetical protein